MGYSRNVLCTMYTVYYVYTMCTMHNTKIWPQMQLNVTTSKYRSVISLLVSIFVLLSPFPFILGLSHFCFIFKKDSVWLETYLWIHNLHSVLDDQPRRRYILKMVHFTSLI